MKFCFLPSSEAYRGQLFNGTAIVEYCKRVGGNQETRDLESRSLRLLTNSSGTPPPTSGVAMTPQRPQRKGATKRLSLQFWTQFKTPCVLIRRVSQKSPQVSPATNASGTRTRSPLSLGPLYGSSCRRYLPFVYLPLTRTTSTHFDYEIGAAGRGVGGAANGLRSFVAVRRQPDGSL